MAPIVLAAALMAADGAGARPIGDAVRPSVAPAAAPAPPAARRLPAAVAEGYGADRVCALIERAAVEHRLPAAYFARLIWKESRFDIAAVSPKGAQGVAQFMPATARIEGLRDPFDPVEAIPVSARHLADLRAEFGNLGLAAAAYNSGRARVARWLAGAAGLPWETLDYVHAITFRPVEWFRGKGREVEPRPLEPERSFAEACRRLPVIETRAFAPGAPMKPWGVQIAGAVTHDAAARAFRRIAARHGGILGGTEPIVIRGRHGLGARYSARVGADSRAEADRLCRQLNRAGGGCVVVRN